jgi:hypothetical protein
MGGNNPNTFQESVTPQVSKSLANTGNQSQDIESSTNPDNQNSKNSEQIQVNSVSPSEDKNQFVKVENENEKEKITSQNTFDQEKTNGNFYVWSKQFLNNATVILNDNGAVLRVRKTSRSLAVVNLGNLSGSHKISFDWKTKADGWYEIPGVSISSKDQPFQLNSCNEALDLKSCGAIISKPNTGIEIKQYSEKNGHYENTINIDSNSFLNFFIVPSNYSENNDHESTLFEISNLKID